MGEVNQDTILQHQRKRRRHKIKLAVGSFVVILVAIILIATYAILSKNYYNEYKENAEVEFYDSVDDSLLKFAVIVSQSNGKWVFCKHKERDAYEVPGGHREAGESILETAKRELQEETGAIRFDMKPLCVYSVTGKTRVNDTGEESFGLLCYAEITEFATELHSEMEKIVLLDELPEEWTYPLIQPKLIEKYLQMKNTIDFRLRA